jgi:tetraacyldisaccharide 4'-kinase
MMRKLLWLPAVIYGGITKVRNALYDHGMFSVYYPSLPVVCVGNLTAGGTGKTPLVLKLADELLHRGHVPVILSRGYGGRIAGPYQVQPHDDARDVGDEPLLMCRRGICSVIIARDRVAGARCIESSVKADVILLDDGLQHRRLGRVCNIVTFFAGNPAAIDAIEHGALLPSGRFREGRDEGLRRADAVALCSRGGSVVPQSVDRVRALVPSAVPLFTVDAKVLPPTCQGRILEKGPVWLFCAIAQPEGFIDSVRDLGYTIAGVTRFPDHHQFSERDLRELDREASGVPLVCTEKDWVKLSGLFCEKVFVVNLEAVVDRELVDLVERRLGAEVGSC